MPRELVATLRPTAEGGQFEGPEDVRLNLLAAAGQAGFKLLDIEAGRLVGPLRQALGR